jgi:hypothetical protein
MRGVPAAEGNEAIIVSERIVRQTLAGGQYQSSLDLKQHGHNEISGLKTAEKKDREFRDPLKVLTSRLQSSKTQSDTQNGTPLINTLTTGALTALSSMKPDR